MTHGDHRSTTPIASCKLSLQSKLINTLNSWVAPSSSKKIITFFPQMWMSVSTATVDVKTCVSILSEVTTAHALIQSIASHQTNSTVLVKSANI